MEASKREKNLKNIYNHISGICLSIENKKYKGLPIDENWLTFDGFVKDNWVRYYRAIIKWRNYQKQAFKRPGDTEKLQNSPIRFIAKVKDNGYTKENTVFTSPSDMTKYVSYTHKYMFEDRLLGTRDIKNILKKRGINISMEQLVRRLKLGYDLFEPCVNNKIKYKGKYLNLVEISKLENVNYAVLKKAYYEFEDIKKAIEKAKITKPLQKHLFEGQMLLRAEIYKIIAERLEMKLEYVRHIFKTNTFPDYETAIQFLQIKKQQQILKNLPNGNFKNFSI